LEFCQVKLEGHARGVTIYIAGFLADVAATRVEAMVCGLREGTSVVRVDLRGVEIIDPTAFVRLARSLNRWRDLKRGRHVLIQFPERSSHAARPSPSSFSLPTRNNLMLHAPTLDIFDAVPERVALHC
jgi:ABC-type transporter Mla MlaB component